MARTLDKEQREAVETDRLAIVVVAGAGSGKTEVVARRIERLLADSSPNDRRVLALSYTTKAADELEERLSETSVDLDLVDAQTIHSFAHELVRQHGSWEGFSPEPEILARDEDRVELLTEWLADAGTHIDPDEVPGVLRELDVARARLRTAYLLDDYLTALAARKALDYPAMLEVATRLVARDWLRNQLVETYGHVIVDEAQNLTPAQYGLISAILGPCPSPINAMLVGDEKQSIVRFAGADPALIGRFESDHRAHRIQLVRNYRSAAAICRIADKITDALRSPTTPQVVSAAPGQVTIAVARDEQAEGAEVATWITQLLRAGLPLGALASGESSSVQPEEIAVIARSAAALRPTAAALEQHGVDYSSASDPADWMASELGAAALALIEYRAGPKHPSARKHLELMAGTDLDDLAASPIVGFAEAVATSDEEPASLFESLRRLAPPDADDGWDSDRALLVETWERFCERHGERERTYSNLHRHISRTQRGDTGVAGVRLLTVHKAQGREFRAVAIIGLNEGQFPSYFAKSEAEQRAELHTFYVAITRASRVLRLSRPQERIGRNGPWNPNPSRFLTLAGATGVGANRS